MYPKFLDISKNFPSKKRKSCRCLQKKVMNLFFSGRDDKMKKNLNEFSLGLEANLANEHLYVKFLKSAPSF
jgi:hypothetical protein